MSIRILTLIALALVALGCTADLGAERPALVAASERAEANTPFTLDAERSLISFTGSRPSVSHTRSFSRFEGRLAVEGGVPVHLSVEVDMTSLVAGTEHDLVQHLLTSDFFDVEHHPTATFTSTAINPLENNSEATHHVVGNLEIRGKKVPLDFDATIEEVGEGFRGRANIALDRYSHGVDYQPSSAEPGESIDRDVWLSLELIFVPSRDVGV